MYGWLPGGIPPLDQLGSIVGDTLEIERERANIRMVEMAFGPVA